MGETAEERYVSRAAGDYQPCIAPGRHLLNSLSRKLKRIVAGFANPLVWVVWMVGVFSVWLSRQ